MRSQPRRSSGGGPITMGDAVNKILEQTIDSGENLMLINASVDGDILYNHASLDGGLSIYNDTAIESISIPNITTLSVSVKFEGNPNMEVADFSSLSNIAAGIELDLDSSPSLISVILTAFNQLDPSAGLHISGAAITTLDLANLITVDTGALLKVESCASLSTVDFTDLATVTGAISLNGNTALSIVSFPSLSTISSGTIALSGCTSLTSMGFGSISGVNGNIVATGCGFGVLSLPFTTIDFGGILNVSANSSLTSFTMSNLLFVNGSLNFGDAPLLTSVSLPVLTTIGDGSNPADVSLGGCATLTTLTLAVRDINQQGALNAGFNGALATVDISQLGNGSGDTLAGQISFTNCISLTSIAVAAAISTSDGFIFDASSCALDTATVDAILAGFAAGLSGTTSGTINLQGGANSSPTGGAGNADYLTLTGAGITVNIN